MRSLNRIFKISLTAVVLSISGALFGGCSCSDESTPKSIRVSSRVIDRNAYELGEEHARLLLSNASDEDYVQENLLDVRSRMSNIESNFGRQSAVDYERGFTDHIRKNCDSLARIIF
ncbi:MAG: hypothetical protein NC411_05555 [Bacteroides sp.]|nr:hypothetical protein [Bacteroides sp.]